MPVQWFPGHMHATRKALAARLPEIDVVIELLDARLPGSSTNPLLAELTQGKPALKVLNKQDLADPEATALWLAEFNARPATHALALDASATAPARQLVAACRELAPLRGGMVKPLRVLICGIPNVGKSTLINTLVGQRSAHTGDEPGITKNEQRIALASDVTLFDTPGMLWPRITVDKSGWHLAASGGIGRNAYDEEEAALELLDSVRLRYAERLRLRYKLGPAAGEAPAKAAALAPVDPTTTPADVLLAEIGRRRGALMSGGRLDRRKAADVVLNDFRGGAWGRITLERPEEFALWWAVGQAQDAERTLRKQRRGKRGARADKAPPEAGAAAPDGTPDPSA